MQMMRNSTKRNFAIPAAATEMPPNPNRAATIEMMKKISAHFSIASSSLAFE